MGARQMHGRHGGRPLIKRLKEFHRLPYRSPYYVIAWRLAWCVPMYTALFVAAVFAALAWGPRAAKDLLIDANRF